LSIGREGDLTKNSCIPCDLLDEIFVERLTGDDAEGFRFGGEGSGDAQVKSAVVAHDVAEISGDELRKSERSRPLGAGAIGLRLIAVPDANFAVQPLRTARTNRRDD
jgi:hypothetical protein